MRNRRTRLAGAFALATSAVLAYPGQLRGQTCVTNPGDGPDICADWDETPDPVHNDDFFVTFTDDDYPDVVLHAESQTWRVWSEDPNNSANPGDIGNITVQQSFGGRIYSVKLKRANGTPGARDVKSFDLTQCCVQWRSDIYDSVISGDVEGDILADYGTVDGGGELELEVQGSVGGEVTARKIVGDGLVIDGELGGDMDVEIVVEDSTVDINSLADGIDLDINAMEAGTSFRIGHDVPASVDIYVHDFGANIDVELGYAQTGDYDVDGDVTLNEPSGLPATTEVTVYGNVGGTLALGDFVYGTAVVNGSVEAGGSVVTGLLFGSLTIGTDVAGTVSSELQDEAGELTVSGDVATGGDINIDTYLNGSLTVVGDVDGDITIGAYGTLGGEVQGDLDVGAVFGTIRVVAGTGLDGDVIDGASITAKRLANNGRLMIDGLCDAPVIVERGTGSGSLIQMILGMDENATLQINADEGEHDAAGYVVIGNPDLVQQDAITTEGCIRIYDEDDSGNTGDYGNLTGTITVNGCHGTTAKDNICIDGDFSSTSIIYIQTGCNPQVPSVEYTCTGCPS